jgi:hypothetical protein
VTALLNRLDDKASEKAAGLDRLAVFGYVCVAVGGLVASVSFGAVAALYVWKGLL